MSSTFEIDASFAGGNIHVEKIEHDEIWLRHEQRDTPKPWFYWSFRVRGGAGRTLRFHFTDGDVLGVRGAAFSADGGNSWEWWCAHTVNRSHELPSFEVTLSESQSDIHLAFCPLYTERHLHNFLEAQPYSPRIETLCQSRQGRAVELIRVGDNPNAPHRVLLTGRHHSCEVIASFALEGVLEVALSDDELGQWWRQNVDLVAIPFMDKDGVENGDQGKMRHPHDHNRDYNGTPDDSIYPEVRELRQYVAQWLDGTQSNYAIDFHCPWIRGDSNEKLYFVGQSQVEAWQQTKEFAAVLEKVKRGPLPYQASNDMPYGVEWNVASSYDGTSFTSWFCSQPNANFGVSLEVPYANAEDVAVTPETARAFGRDLAVALREFLPQSG